MPDQVVTQANATDHFDRWLQPSRKAMLLRDLHLLYSQSKVYVRQDGGYTTAGARMVTDWDLKGVKLSDSGRNTAADARLWIRITANVGNWDIDVYKATGAGAGNKVLSATNVAAGATITWTAANTSGISGTAKLGSSVAAIAADTYAIQCWVGYAEMDRQVYDGTHQEDGDLKSASERVNGRVASRLQELVDDAAATAKTDPFQTITGRIWKLPPRLIFLDKRTEPNDDVISVLVDGVMERLRQNWKDNTTVQKVPVTTLAAGAVTYLPSGKGTVVVGTPGENLEPGLVQLVCVEDALPGATRFRVTFTPDDGTGAIIGRNLLTLSKVWDDPDIPAQLTLSPTFTKTGDGTNLHLAAVADLSAMTGLTKDNSDDGKLYWKVVASGANFIFEFYSDSNRTKKVAQSPAVAAATAFTATQQNKSGLSVSWKSGSAPVAATVGDVTINPFKKGTSTTAPDQMQFAITRSAKGKIQEAAREFYGWKLNSGASPTFADTFIEKCGAFFDGNP